mmetsp:Transcript_5156/g.8679  ORF Transcript_5156/g.8679 Transcript_5156/m.8679 type:complete len:300 (-) Transcript_5156:374-1273(-)
MLAKLEEARRTVRVADRHERVRRRPRLGLLSRRRRARLVDGHRVVYRGLRVLACSERLVAHELGALGLSRELLALALRHRRRRRRLHVKLALRSPAIAHFDRLLRHQFTLHHLRNEVLLLRQLGALRDVRDVVGVRREVAAASVAEDVHVFDAGMVHLLADALHQKAFAEAQRDAIGEVDLHRVDHGLLEVESQILAVRHLEVACDKLALESDRAANTTLDEDLDHSLQRRRQLECAVRAIFEEHHTLAGESGLLEGGGGTGLVGYLELGRLLESRPLVPDLLRFSQGGVCFLIFLLGF